MKSNIIGLALRFVRQIEICSIHEQGLSCTSGSVLWGKYLKKSLKINDLGLDIVEKKRAVFGRRKKAGA